MRQTVFLVPNLHCPSCTSHIEEALYALQPSPKSVSHSIVSHTVTVDHSDTLSASKISNALDQAGYEVYGIIRDSTSLGSANGSDSYDQEERGIPEFAFESAIQRWRSYTSNADDEKRRRHIENCDLCQSKILSSRSESLPESILKTRESSITKAANRDQDSSTPFVITESAQSKTRLWQVTLTIEGMTCSSCVGNVTRALEEKPWVQSAHVSLLTHSACVTLAGEHHTKELTGIVEDVGYGATLEQVELLPSGDREGPSTTGNLWQASFAVGGMTCSSCVGTVTKALQEHRWIKNVDVNLVSNSATIVFDGRTHLQEIENIIKDVGYEAKLNDVADVGQKTSRDMRRQVAIRLSGMYCEHCPPRVELAVATLDQVTVEKPPTIDDPILKISYLPDSPRLTIRRILQSISAADAAFHPSIYHPMSLEERSRKMHVREQWHILYRVILSLTAAIPALIIGVVYMNLVSENDRGRTYLMERIGGVSRAEWANFIIATPVYFFAADVFHRRNLKELRALWRPGSRVPIRRRFYRFGSMNMLISFGTTIAYFASIAELGIAASRSYERDMAMSSSSLTYFDSVVFLTMFLLIGRLIEAYTKAKTGDAVAALGKLRPTEAILISDDIDASGHIERSSPRQIRIDLLEIGDIVRVLNGASPPCDGLVIDGESSFDESSLTGESKLVHKLIGDKVHAGTVNKDSPISVQVTEVSGTSMLDQIMKIVREGQARRAPVERVADLLTGYFVPVITLIAISTWIIWLSLGLSGALPDNYLDVEVGGWAFWSLQFAISVFIIACPCGIGLAAPTSLFVGGGLAAKHGILAQGGGEAFQEASGLDVIVFDKTGTLTQGGEPKITDHEFPLQSKDNQIKKSDLVAIVKKFEEDSSHPIAKALVVFCESISSTEVQANDICEIAGKGMKGSFAVQYLGGRVIEALIGNEALMTDYDITIAKNVATMMDSWKEQAKSIAILATRPNSDAPSLSTDWQLSAIFAISDPLRPEAAGVIKALQKRDIDVWMISGDNPTTAYAVGNQVGIHRNHIIAGVLPSQKADKIKHLQKTMVKKDARLFGRKLKTTQQRATVAMVGDGINDSPALTMADVGIAIGSGSDVAISSAKFVLLSSNLASLLTLIDLSRIVFRRIKFNFAWAVAYNLLALPVAAGVLYPLRSNGAHIRLDPVWAALAMALSSVSVICSSLLLRTRLPLVGFRAKQNV